MDEAPKTRGPKGQFAPGMGGRPKGVPNKNTQSARAAIALAAHNLGGAERLVAWAKEDPLNERAFWASIYPKLLPLQVTGEDGDAIKTESKWTIELIRAAAPTA